VSKRGEAPLFYILPHLVWGEGEKGGDMDEKALWGEGKRGKVVKIAGWEE